MTAVYIALVVVALLGTLFVIDRKIKGSKSIIAKVFYLGFFTLLIAGSVYFYGATFLESFHVDVRSFTKIKEFFSSRIVAILLMLLMIFFVFIKTIHLVISFRSHKMVPATKKETALVLLSVVFDIAVIPNILNNVFGAVLASISLLGTGLACIKLVFSFDFSKNKEVLAWQRFISLC